MPSNTSSSTVASGGNITLVSTINKLFVVQAFCSVTVTCWKDCPNGRGRNLIRSSTLLVCFSSLVSFHVPQAQYYYTTPIVNNNFTVQHRVATPTIEVTNAAGWSGGHVFAREYATVNISVGAAVDSGAAIFYSYDGGGGSSWIAYAGPFNVTGCNNNWELVCNTTITAMANNTNTIASFTTSLTSYPLLLHSSCLLSSRHKNRGLLTSCFCCVILVICRLLDHGQLLHSKVHECRRFRRRVECFFCRSMSAWKCSTLLGYVPSFVKV